MAKKQTYSQTKRNGQRNSSMTSSTKQTRAAVGQTPQQAVAGFFASILDIIRSSRVALLLVVVLAIVLIGGLFDVVANYGKAYAGVSVGGIDVGGMTAEEIEDAIADEYASRLNAAGVTIYANQDAFNDRTSDYDYYSEEVSVEEDRANRRAWSTDSASLQAYIDYSSLSEQALSAGRGGVLERARLFFTKPTIDVSLNFNEAIVESLANEIDLSIGQPLVNFGVDITDGYVSVIPGSDGDMVNREKLKEQISQQLLSPDADNRAFVVDTEYTPVQIDEQSATLTAQAISEAIEGGILFVCGNEQWHADAASLGSWIQTPLSKKDDGTYALAPSFALQAARTSVLSHIQPHYNDGDGHVRFAKVDGDILVRATSQGTFPLVGDALEELNLFLFSTTDSTSSVVSVNPEGVITVELGTAEIPGTMTLDEALSFGIVSPISEFTTEYTTGAFERNTNIHLAADLLDDSIIAADGGGWSFNDTAGECNEEKGFLEARAVAGDELIDEIGGGICQVATTVFNAVYEAGYPITERHNHSIYFSSYPQGRDAAISWPSPDLKWENNSPSDILLCMTYTDSTVTCTLYGEDMGYVVESEEGEWEEGASYTTVYDVDETLYPGVEYVRTYGENGHTITVTRNVYDTNNELLLTDYFTSVYSPQNTVIVRGPSA